MLLTVKNYLLKLQQEICQELESLDGQEKFQTVPWSRECGGGGSTKVMSNGAIFSKAGVNFSHVYGDQLPPSACNNRLEFADGKFHAMGVSVVIHPDNPYIPTSHANVRFFIIEKMHQPPVWWFGGGFDLTPYYGFQEDCYHWHKIAHAACQPFGEHLYSRFKQAADDYFFIKHRQEQRGIGGLFFDDFNENGFNHSFGLLQSIGDHFMLAYAPIVSQRKRTAYGSREKEFQRHRRGRYVEFNLIYDRGTLFGLQSGGNDIKID